MKWPEASIAELEESGAIIEIQDGNHGEKHPTVADYVDDGIPFVMANDLNAGFVDTKTCHFITEDTARRLRIGFSVSGDVLLTHKGTLGNVAIVKDANPFIMLTPQVTYYRTDNIKLLNIFLAYAFRDPAFQARMRAGGDQGTRPYIGIRAQRRLRITFPEPAIQRRVAEVLSIYDESIENNRRRMGLLEEAARQIYQEWFVRLRFPGHEHTRNSNGIPEGWRAAPFSDLAAFVNGYPFKPDELLGDGLPIVKIPELRDGVTPKTPRNTGENIPEKYLLEDGDLLFSWSGTLLIEFWYDGPAILNQHLFRVEPNDLCSAAFLLFALREALPEFTNQTVGATMKHIRKSALTTVTTKLPPSALLTQFDEVATDTYQQVLNLRRQNQKLRAARDLLLPRLMSGEITV